jgi:fused signal recognition particle receptor
MMDLNIILIVSLLLAVGAAFVYLKIVFLKKDKSKLSQPLEVSKNLQTLPKAPVPSPPSPSPSLPPSTPPISEKPTLKKALENTSSHIFGRLASLFGKEDSNHFDEIEEILYTSDLGPMTVERLMETVKEQLSRAERKDLSTVKAAFQSEFQKIFNPLDGQVPLTFSESGPTVIMVVGVNGVGKTTSIGKLAARLAQENKKILVAAGDTFRAAAGNQLKTWTERAQVEIFLPEQVTDPSAIAFDAVAKAFTDWAQAVGLLQAGDDCAVDGKGLCQCGVDVSAPTRSGGGTSGV